MSWLASFFRDMSRESRRPKSVAERRWLVAAWVLFMLANIVLASGLLPRLISIGLLILAIVGLVTAVFRPALAAAARRRGGSGRRS